MDKSDINTINTTYKNNLTDKITIITTSVKALIANYQAQLSEIERLQKSKSGESDESDESGESGEPQNCSTVEAEFNEYKENVTAKIADLLTTMENDASRLEKLNNAVTTALEDDGGNPSGNPFGPPSGNPFGPPIAGGRKHKRSKKRSKHNKRRTTHKKQSRRRRRH